MVSILSEKLLPTESGAFLPPGGWRRSAYWALLISNPLLSQNMAEHGTAVA